VSRFLSLNSTAQLGYTVPFTLVQTPEAEHGLAVKKIFSGSLLGPPGSAGLLHCRVCWEVVTPPVLKYKWSPIVTLTNSKSWGFLA